jgi:hypothetical protein
MLVSLGVNSGALAAGASQTYTYSPTSLQKVLIFLDDAETSNHWNGVKITVQLGSQVICNGADMWGLVGLTNLQTGSHSASNDGFACIDFGSIEVADSNDNLYVTLTGGASEVSSVDVSAIVDEPGLGTPVRYTQYADNTFTSDNCLMGVSFDSAFASVAEDNYNIEVRTSINSSAPNLISCSSWYKSKSVGATYANNFGLVCVNAVPLRTTFNYSSSAVTDRIITVEQMGLSRPQRSAGVRSGKIARMQAGR